MALLHIEGPLPLSPQVALDSWKGEDYAAAAAAATATATTAGKRDQSKSFSPFGDWQAALQGVIDEATAPGASMKDVGGGLPTVLVSRVESSPFLLNLANALARHKAVFAEYQARGAPQRVLEYQKDKADALMDTLRTILCL